MTTVLCGDWRRGRARRSAIILIVSVALVGCAQNGGISGMGQNEAAGTGIGAAAGGLAGVLLASTPGGKFIAGLAGAAIGGFIGNRVGAALDEQDQKAIQDKAKQALLNQPDNAKTTWTSNHSGATATIVPENTRVEQRQVKVVRDANVAPAENLDFIGASYWVKSATHVRLAPSTNSDIASTLSGGSAIWVVGKVHGQPWLLVSKRGTSIGYVTASNVVPKKESSAVASTSKDAKPAASGAGSSPSAAGESSSEPATFDLDTSAPVRTTFDLDSLEKTPGSATKVDTVTANVTCRDIKTTVTAKGNTETSNQTVCKSPDGSWDLE